MIPLDKLPLLVVTADTDNVKDEPDCADKVEAALVSLAPVTFPVTGELVCVNGVETVLVSFAPETVPVILETETVLVSFAPVEVPVIPETETGGTDVVVAGIGHGIITGNGNG